MDQIASRPQRSQDPRSRLRIGLLVDGVIASQHAYGFATWAQSHPRLAVTHLIVTDMKRSSRWRAADALHGLIRCVSGLSAALSDLALLVVERCERHLLKREEHHFAHLRTSDLRLLVKNVL